MLAHCFGREAEPGGDRRQQRLGRMIEREFDFSDAEHAVSRPWTIEVVDLVRRHQEGLRAERERALEGIVEQMN
ncbi:hypothetical protein Acid7E03_32100 [Acidisoma sp. 7E03]